MYNIELNVADINIVMKDRIENAAEANGCEITYNGLDHLVILNKDCGFDKFKKTIDDIVYICAFYGVRYESLLV